MSFGERTVKGVSQTIHRGLGMVGSSFSLGSCPSPSMSQSTSGSTDVCLLADGVRPNSVGEAFNRLHQIPGERQHMGQQPPMQLCMVLMGTRSHLFWITHPDAKAVCHHPESGKGEAWPGRLTKPQALSATIHHKVPVSCRSSSYMLGRRPHGSCGLAWVPDKCSARISGAPISSCLLIAVFAATFPRADMPNRSPDRTLTTEFGARALSARTFHAGSWG